MNNLFGIFAAGALVILFSISAFAQPEVEIYGIATDVRRIRELPVEMVDPDIERPTFPESILYVIDPDTGQPTEVGPITGYTQCTGLDFHPITEELFAVCVKIEDEPLPAVTTNEDESITLLMLNRNTGQPTEIGSLGDIGPGDLVTDISFRSDGVLFAVLSAGIMGSGDGEEGLTTSTFAANSLGIINTQTGQLSLVGSTGVPDLFSSIGFNELDVLFQCTDNDNNSNLVNILNQSNGNATFVRNLILPPDFLGLVIVPSKDLDKSTNHFFAFLNTRGDINEEGVSTNNEEAIGNFLVTINQSSGDVDLIGMVSELGNDFAAIAVLSEKVITEVPTLSEYGIMAAVLLLLGASVIYLRRRQYQQ